VNTIIHKHFKQGPGSSKSSLVPAEISGSLFLSPNRFKSITNLTANPGSAGIGSDRESGETSLDLKSSGNNIYYNDPYECSNTVQYASYKYRYHKSE